MTDWMQHLIDLANDGVNRLTDEDALDIMDYIKKMEDGLKESYENGGLKF